MAVEFALAPEDGTVLTPQAFSATYHGAEMYEDCTEEERDAKAARLGCSVLKGHSRLLLLDLDTLEAVAFFWSQLALLENIMPEITCEWVIETFPSRNGNTHVTIYTGHPMDMTERLAVQAMLGSDLQHELLSYMSHHRGHHNPSVLFRPIPGFVPLSPDEPELI